MKIKLTPDGTIIFSHVKESDISQILGNINVLFYEDYEDERDEYTLVRTPERVDGDLTLSDLLAMLQQEPEEEMKLRSVEEPEPRPEEPKKCVPPRQKLDNPLEEVNRICRDLDREYLEDVPEKLEEALSNYTLEDALRAVVNKAPMSSILTTLAKITAEYCVR